MNCYYGWNTDGEVLKESSSGGIFTALAEATLRQGGAVFGVRMDPETYTAVHEAAFSMEALGALRGSKYQQSSAGPAYARAAELLGQGVPVLFSGTPCQIAALRNFLRLKGRGTEGLVCAEVLCHGVTSAKVVRAYVRAAEARRGAKVTDLRFRTKEKPWYRGSAMKITYDNGRSETADYLTDRFAVAYTGSMILRPSCYQCPFARQDGRPGDITIGDYWGAEEEITDAAALRQGVGLVLTNTEKGEAAFRALTESGAVYARPLDYGRAARRNDALVKPAKRKTGREDFFARMEKEDYISLAESVYRKKLMKNRMKLLIGYDRTRKLKALKRKLKG